MCMLQSECICEEKAALSRFIVVITYYDKLLLRKVRRGAKNLSMHN